MIPVPYQGQSREWNNTYFVNIIWLNLIKIRIFFWKRINLILLKFDFFSDSKIKHGFLNFKNFLIHLNICSRFHYFPFPFHDSAFLNNVCYTWYILKNSIFSLYSFNLDNMISVSYQGHSIQWNKACFAHLIRLHLIKHYNFLLKMYSFYMVKIQNTFFI